MSSAPARRLSTALRRPPARAQSAGATRARRKFLRYFSGGFADPTYVEWERGYKWRAHTRWNELLDRATHRRLLDQGRSTDVAARAVGIESRTNLLFSFEKMALRDAVRAPRGARAFAEGLFELLHGDGALAERFTRWCDVVAALPRKQTRVLTWPVVTVFPFIAQPREHFFVKPAVTRAAARAYGLEVPYRPGPDWPTYAGMLDFARVVRRDVRDLRPRDMIDVQSFIWVQGSDEYPD